MGEEEGYGMLRSANAPPPPWEIHKQSEIRSTQSEWLDSFDTEQKVTTESRQQGRQEAKEIMAKLAAKFGSTL